SPHTAAVRTSPRSYPAQPGPPPAHSPHCFSRHDRCNRPHHRAAARLPEPRYPARADHLRAPRAPAGARAPALHPWLLSRHAPVPPHGHGAWTPPARPPLQMRSSRCGYRPQPEATHPRLVPHQPTPRTHHPRPQHRPLPPIHPYEPSQGRTALNMPSAATTRSACSAPTTAGAPPGSPGVTSVTAALVRICTPVRAAPSTSARCRRRRCTPISAVLALVDESCGSSMIDAPLLLLVPSARVGMPRAATSSSVNPRPVNAATALRDIANPAPTSSRRRARSSTVTSQPWRASAIAADSPAIPAPATTALWCMSHLLPRRAALCFYWAVLPGQRYR